MSQPRTMGNDLEDKTLYRTVIAFYYKTGPSNVIYGPYDLPKAKEMLTKKLNETAGYGVEVEGWIESTDVSWKPWDEADD